MNYLTPADLFCLTLCILFLALLVIWLGDSAGRALKHAAEQPFNFPNQDE